jgi:hypothetical protein
LEDLIHILLELASYLHFLSFGYLLKYPEKVVLGVKYINDWSEDCIRAHDIKGYFKPPAITEVLPFTGLDPSENDSCVDKKGYGRKHRLYAVALGNCVEFHDSGEFNHYL